LCNGRKSRLTQKSVSTHNRPCGDGNIILLSHQRGCECQNTFSAHSVLEHDNNIITHIIYNKGTHWLIGDLSDKLGVAVATVQVTRVRHEIKRSKAGDGRRRCSGTMSKRDVSRIIHIYIKYYVVCMCISRVRRRVQGWDTLHEIL